MNRRPFYKVDTKAWLFNPAKPGEEEEVRQWCLHELIRCYGVEVNNLVTELPVKVGTRYPRADIAIFQGPDNPYCIIECKKPGYKDHEVAIQQAISYAMVAKGNVQFVVYTNGEVWRVLRRIGEKWFSISDLPDFKDNQPVVSWRNVSNPILELAPILAWLDMPVPAKSAAKYFAAMQEFFVGENAVNYVTSKQLRIAADNILRPLTDMGRHLGYLDGKVRVAYKELEDYWVEHGDPIPSLLDENLWELAHQAKVLLLLRLDKAAGIGGVDYAAIKLIMVILEYLEGLRYNKGRYKDIDLSIQNAVREYLDVAMKLSFNSYLPALSDTSESAMLRDLYAPSWEQYAQESTWCEKIKIWVGLSGKHKV